MSDAIKICENRNFFNYLWFHLLLVDLLHVLPIVLFLQLPDQNRLPIRIWRVLLLGVSFELKRKKVTQPCSLIQMIRRCSNSYFPHVLGTPVCAVQVGSKQHVVLTEHVWSRIQCEFYFVLNNLKALEWMNEMNANEVKPKYMTNTAWMPAS